MFFDTYHVRITFEFRPTCETFSLFGKENAFQIWIWSDFVLSSVFGFGRETNRDVWQHETKNLLVGSSSAVVWTTGVGFWWLPVVFDKSRLSTIALCWLIWDTVNLAFSDLENDIFWGERNKTIVAVWHLRGDWPTPSAGEYGGSESGGLSGKLCLKKSLLFFSPSNSHCCYIDFISASLFVFLTNSINVSIQEKHLGRGGLGQGVWLYLLLLK